MADLGQILLCCARNAIGERFAVPALPVLDHPRLAEPGATFVTLMQDGQLRGCIGTLEAWRPLAEDVAKNAVAAAFHDLRFKPLAEDEFGRVCVEVSLLTPPEALPVNSEEDACRRLEVYVDGVILEAGGRRVTFLPQVWHDLPDPHDFLRNLKLKAGLPAEGWRDDFRLQRYQVLKWKE